MALTVAQLLVKVGGDNKDANDKLDQTNKKVNESSGFFKDALSNALGFAGASVALGGLGNVAGFLKDQIGAVFSATNELDQANAQLVSTLK